MYLSLPYTENKGQINLDNITYIMDKYPAMYKTKSSPSNINIKSQIDIIATITTPDFILLGPVGDRKYTKKRIPITSRPQINVGMEIHRLYTDGKVK